jgi:hypothetical protein
MGFGGAPPIEESSSDEGQVVSEQAIVCGAHVPGRSPALWAWEFHWKAGLANAILSGSVAFELGLALDEFAEILQMRGLLERCLLGEVLIVLGDKSELQVPQIGVETVEGHARL